MVSLMLKPAVSWDTCVKVFSQALRGRWSTVWLKKYQYVRIGRDLISHFLAQNRKRNVFRLRCNKPWWPFQAASFCVSPSETSVCKNSLFRKCRRLVLFAQIFCRLSSLKLYDWCFILQDELVSVLWTWIQGARLASNFKHLYMINLWPTEV